MTHPEFLEDFAKTKLYVGYTGTIVGIRSTKDTHPVTRTEYGTIMSLKETANFGWAVFVNETGRHLICLG